MKENFSHTRRILHLTPHLGGGVGTVLLNWVQFDAKNEHSIATLDFANENAQKICAKAGIPLYAQKETMHICELIAKADIVVIHFWNHPLLYDFLIRNPLPPCRLIIWSHISGLEPPNVITPKIMDYADLFLYTTPISRSIAQHKTLLSTGNITPLLKLSPQAHQGFTVGYVGTVDYVKMHPQYLATLAQTQANTFLIVGGNKHEEIARSCTDPRFIFSGKVDDIKPYLQKMDVFGYLLAPKHFGTAEQSLQEAMAAGIVPVVLNNLCESALVKHGETGLIAHSLEEYICHINTLKNNVTLRKKLSLQAQEHAKQYFSLERLCLAWEKNFTEIMQKNKCSKHWDMQGEVHSLNIFLESLGSHATLFTHTPPQVRKKILQQEQWQCLSKGSPRQYFTFLGGKELAQIIDTM